MTQLNPAQQAAVDYNGDAMNLLVVAGAGCGKTRTIISRAARLIQQGMNPASILLITFTNRAAKEIRQRIRQEVGDLARELQISTFHGYCFSVMTRLPKSFEIKGLTILDADDQQSLVSLIIGQRNFDKEFKKSLPKPARLINIYSYSRNACLSLNQYMQDYHDFSHEVREGIRSIFELYESEKKRRGYLDFDDLLEVYADILDKKPKLKHDLARQFSEVLVDELQDTNPLQVRTLRHFADEGVRLFCVGDPAQSIYGFRGASFEFIQRFDQQFDNTHKFLLADNYRSDQNILNLSNWLLDESDIGYELRLKSALDIDEEKPNLIEFNNHFDEAEWIASQIRREEENGTRLKDQMVLIRSAYDGRQLEAELISRKIPYMFIGGTSLIKAAHVKDFFSLLRAVRSAEDELAWVRYLTLFPKVGNVTASKIIKQIEEDAYSDTAKSIETVLGVSHAAAAIVREVGSETDFVRQADKAMQLLNETLSKRYEQQHWDSRRKDIAAVVSSAPQFTSLSEMIDTYTLEPIHSTMVTPDDEDDKLVLITVHSAKGTEADVCYVLNCSFGNYPHKRSWGDADDEEEDRRVLYVALTRAKRRLFITSRSLSDGGWFNMDASGLIQGQAYFLEGVEDTDLVNVDSSHTERIVHAGLSGLSDDY